MISRRAGLSVVMPALGAGIHVFLSCRAEGVDGRDKPGHDVVDEVHLIVMPALGAGIHVFLSCRAEGVDGPDKPGHDVSRRERSDSVLRTAKPGHDDGRTP
ncbi:MAG TPA: hypothetical protein VFU97_23270 [Xanthobacteraceae bacterium]|nr:hypothetical protein [Xanthobacteraceae bacterium]